MNKTREYIKEKVKERLSNLSSNGELHKNIWMYDMSEDIINSLTDNISENDIFEDSFDFRKICRMFNLDVGGGMKKYRKLFLNYLSTKPEQTREKLWNNIIYTLQRKERYNKIPEAVKKQYPSTFSEAYKYYAS